MKTTAQKLANKATKFFNKAKKRRKASQIKRWYNKLCGIETKRQWGIYN